MLAALEVKLSPSGSIQCGSLRHTRSVPRAASPKVLWEHTDDHDTAARRKPQSTRTEETTIAIPTVLKPIVTTSSCHDRALWPAPIIGERLAVPKIAASVVAIQFLYVVYSALPPSGVEKVSPPSRRHRDEKSPVHNSFQMRGESHPRVIELLLDKSRVQAEHARSTDACYPRRLSSHILFNRHGPNGRSVLPPGREEEPRPRKVQFA